jgi:hypothetical protein
MKALILFLLLTSNVFAAANDARISDKDGDVLSINSDGTANITTTNTLGSGTAFGALDKRVSDNDGHSLTVNSDGTVTAVVGSPY